jgi:5'-nucleotidase
MRMTPLGVELAGTLSRTGVVESPLGNLWADALRERSGADIALNHNGIGGLRADLPPGPITFGQLYDTFPFDNRLVKVHLSASALESGLANALRRGRRGWFGISGAKVRVTCDASRIGVELLRPSGEPIPASALLTVVGMDSLLGSQTYASLFPTGGTPAQADAPIVREVVEDWLRQQPSPILADAYNDETRRRLEFAGPTPCPTQ